MLAKYTKPLQAISRSSTRLFGGSEPKNEHVTEHTTSSTSSPPNTFNVVLFGETGVGKSSVINLIAQKEIAKVSSDVNGCTMRHQRYDIPFDGMNFAIYDTVGLEEPQMGVNGYLKAIEQALMLINRLGEAGGIHLLLFCLRGGRITATTQSNYRLFRECLCHGKVPIALVFTGLEREEKMEDWWERNKKDIEGYGIRSVDHACITAVQDDETDHKFLESQVRIRRLLKDRVTKHDPFSPEPYPWFARFAKGMITFIKGKKAPKKNQIMKVLTQRCKLDQETARKVADMMENGDAETNKGEDSQERSGGNEPGEEMGLEKNPTNCYSSSSERAEPAAGLPNNESVPDGRDKEDLRGVNGDDEPENEREAVSGELPTKDDSPPKEHEGSQAGDREKPAKKSIDESMSNGHDQGDQQAGIKGGEHTETGKISTNGGSLLDEDGREGDRLPRRRQGSGGRTTEAATRSMKDDSPSDGHEKKGVQQTELGERHDRKKTETPMVSPPFSPKAHSMNGHGREEDRLSWERRGSGGRTTEVATQPKDDSLSDEHERRKVQQAEPMQGGGRKETGVAMVPPPIPPKAHYRNEHGREEDRLSWKQRGSGGKTTETAIQSMKDDSLSDKHERKDVQQAEPGQGHGKETGAAMVPLPIPPMTPYRNEYPPAGKDESGSRDGQGIRVAKGSTMDGSSSDMNEKLRATQVQSGEKRTPKGIPTNDNPSQTRKILSSDWEGDWEFAEKEGAGDQSPAVEQKVPGAFTFKV